MNRLTSFVIVALIITAGAAVADDTEITGFVDASWFGTSENGVSTFGLDQAEIDIVRTIENGRVRVDIEWVKNGDAWAQDLEQGYLAIDPCKLPGWTLTLGKFNAPIGFELLDAPDMYQYSHALVFDYGLPTNLTGLMGSRALGNKADLAIYVVNGWDDNDRADDGGKSFGGRFGWSLGETGGVGVSMINGTEFDNGTGTEFDRNVFDIDVTLTPAEGLIIGGEFNKGSMDTGVAEMDWTGFMVMAHRDFTDKFGLTGRFDSFSDDDGGILPGNIKQTRTAFTIAPTFVLGDGMGALFELRFDSSDEDVFVDGDGAATGSATAYAFEMTYGF